MNACEDSWKHIYYFLKCLCQEIKMCKTITVKNHTISSQKSIICVPVIKTTADEILSEIKQDIDAGTEFIEFRADFFKDLMDKDKLLDLLKKIDSFPFAVILLSNSFLSLYENFILSRVFLLDL